MLQYSKPKNLETKQGQIRATARLTLKTKDIIIVWCFMLTVS
jgi:hypothetical protein